MYKHDVGAYDFPEKKETKATDVAWAEKETFIMPYIILAWWPFSRLNMQPPGVPSFFKYALGHVFLYD